MPGRGARAATSAIGPTLYELESGEAGRDRALRAPPKDIRELRDQLTRLRWEAAASVAAVARFAIEQPLDVAMGTTRSVAAASSVPTASVLRLASLLGFEGFRDMREFFRGLLR